MLIRVGHKVLAHRAGNTVKLGEPSYELKYRAITPLQKTFICNGCGAKGGVVPVPNFLFKASCNQHDFYYWRGGNEADRKWADIQFYWAMLEDAEEGEDPIVRTFMRHAGRLYYSAVRTFGADAFHYSERPRDVADLSAAMLKAGIIEV